MYGIVEERVPAMITHAKELLRDNHMHNRRSMLAIALHNGAIAV